MTNETTQSSDWSFIRAVLIEAESGAAEGFQLLLKSAGYHCDRRSLGASGLDVASLSEYDIVVMDLTSPRVDGAAILRRFWTCGLDLPVLILAGPVEFDHRILALGLRPDHHLTVPFEKDALILRVRKIVEQTRGPSRTLEAGCLRLDLTARNAEAKGRPLCLTHKEFSVLELLCRSEGEVVGNLQFLEQLYQGREKPDLRIIDVFICNLRRKLRLALGDELHIETARGRGYMLCRVSDQKEAEIVQFAEIRQHVEAQRPERKAL